MVSRDLIRYQVRHTVARRGRWRTWGAAARGFERRLAERDSAAVAARVDSEVRRRRDYAWVVIAATVVGIGARCFAHLRSNV